MEAVDFLFRVWLIHFGRGWFGVFRLLCGWLRVLEWFCSWVSKRVVVCLNRFQLVTASMVCFVFSIAWRYFLPRSPSDTVPKQGFAEDTAGLRQKLTCLSFFVSCLAFWHMTLSSLVFCWSSSFVASVMGVAVKVVGAVRFLFTRPICWRLSIMR